MAYSFKKRINIFFRNSGECYFCKADLIFPNYGKTDVVGAWEVHHKLPKALNGSNKLKNLAPSCPSCNRSAKDNII